MIKKEINELKKIRTLMKTNNTKGIEKFYKYVDQFDYDVVNRDFGFPINIHDLVELTEYVEIKDIIRVESSKQYIHIYFSYQYCDWELSIDTEGFIELYNDDCVGGHICAVGIDDDTTSEISENIDEYMMEQSNLVKQRKDKLEKLDGN
jgi:hypothetical protein